MARETISDNIKKVHMGAGRTHEQMEQLRRQQVNGEIGTVAANRAGEGEIKDEHFAKEFTDYEIPEHESGNYAVAMEARLFDHQTGRKLSRPKIQYFDPKTFDNLLKTNGFHGHVTYILHDPTLGAKKKKGDEQSESDFIKSQLVTDSGKIKTTGPGQVEKTANPPGQEMLVGANNPEEVIGGADLNNVQSDQPLVNVDELTTETKARKAYMDLTGKQPDNRWGLDRLKKEINEIQGNITE